MSNDDPIRFRSFADEDDDLWGQRAEPNQKSNEPSFRRFDAEKSSGRETPAVGAQAKTWGGVVAWGTGLALVAGVAFAVMLLPHHPASKLDGSGSGSGSGSGPGSGSGSGAALQVHRVTAAPSQVPANALLPCYVDGSPAGSRSLPDCARRNGVASGRLDVGLTPKVSPPLPTSIPVPYRAPPTGATVAQLQPDRSVPPQSTAVGGGYRERRSGQPSDFADSLHAAQTFYEGLADADGGRAASAVVPEKRGSGPLSAGAIDRFYSSLRAPLRLTRLYALDDHTVIARYSFVDRNGAVCQGAARVTTTERDGEIYVQGIRALNGC